MVCGLTVTDVCIKGHASHRDIGKLRSQEELKCRPEFNRQQKSDKAISKEKHMSLPTSDAGHPPCPRQPHRRLALGRNAFSSRKSQLAFSTQNGGPESFARCDHQGLRSSWLCHQCAGQVTSKTRGEAYKLPWYRHQAWFSEQACPTNCTDRETTDIENRMEKLNNQKTAQCWEGK